MSSPPFLGEVSIDERGQRLLRPPTPRRSWLRGPAISDIALRDPVNASGIGVRGPTLNQCVGHESTCVGTFHVWLSELKHDQACPGSTGAHLTAVLHCREAILLPPSEKGRADD